jgi:hypothetical protein
LTSTPGVARIHAPSPEQSRLAILPVIAMAEGDVGSAETVGTSFRVKLVVGGSPAQNQFLDLRGPGAYLSES